MCPDEELLSSFVDAEVPSPWKERIEQHLLSCSACGAKVESYRLLGRSLSMLSSPEERKGIGDAKARIAASLAHGKRRAQNSDPAAPEWIQRLLSARIALPLPVLAGGIAVVVFLAGIMFGAVRFMPGTSRTIASSTRTIDSAQFDAEALASYMRQALIQPVTIVMPGDATLDTYGRPVFVASDPLMIQVSTTLGGSVRQ